jgi:hypothetical protein
MTLEEFREQVVSTPYADWYSPLKIDLNPLTGPPLIIQGFVSIYEYFLTQTEKWQKLEIEPNSILKGIPNVWKDCLESIKSSTTPMLEENINTRNSAWNSVLQTIMQSSPSLIPSEHPAVIFLLKLQNRESGTQQGAYQFLTNQYNYQSLSDKNYLVGIHLALNEFLGNSLERQDANKAAIEVTKSLVANVQAKIAESERILQDHMTAQNKLTDALDIDFEKFKAERDTNIAIWFNDTRNEIEGYHTRNTKRQEELEKAYNEKLSLSAPAEYWRKRGDELRKQGQYYFWVLVVLLLIGAGSLYAILWQAPGSIILNWFDDNHWIAVKWSIIFVAFITTLGFAIRAVMKVMFSSFHLARDCEERHTLTYFYLSLLESGKAINEAERNLVMQSLFSRADTGLLKDDSSPTMPSDISRFFGKTQ